MGHLSTLFIVGVLMNMKRNSLDALIRVSLNLNDYFSFFIIGFCSLFIWSCQPSKPIYPPDHPNSLQALVQTWVRDYQGQADPQQGRARLKQHLKNTLMTSSRLESLLHPTVAHPLSLHYKQTLIPKILKEGPKVIQDAIGKGMTEIMIRRIGPNVGKYLSPGDLILLEHMPSRPALFTVRFHLKDDPLGLRLNAFFYDQGRWKSLFKLGELLEFWNRDQLQKLKAEHQ
jgi:hypothetical protein